MDRANEGLDGLTPARGLCGHLVSNGSGGTLGSVSEVIIDMASGRVAYVVVAAGGFMGMGEHLFTVPWQSLRMASDGHTLVLQGHAAPEPAPHILPQSLR